MTHELEIGSLDERYARLRIVQPAPRERQRCTSEAMQAYAACMKKCLYGSRDLDGEDEPATSTAWTTSSQSES